MRKFRHLPAAPTWSRLMAPGERITPHHHDEHQLVYAGSGVLTVTTDAGTWVAPGTRAIWVPAGCVHAHHAHAALELHLLGLPTSANPLGLDTPTVLGVGPLLRELILACTRDPGADGPEHRRMIDVLLDQLRVSTQRPVALPAPTEPRVRAVCDLLRRDPADGRTLGELGRQVGAGERTLSRLFRDDLGMTFPQWRTQLRLHRALILLADDEPVTSVAHRCGWSSAGAFIDAFRRSFGETPGAHHRRGAGLTRPAGSRRSAG